MKKKVFFEKINIFNLIISLFLFPIFGKIIYRTSKILEKNSPINKFLENFFFIRIGSRYLDTKYYNRGFETKQFLKERVYNNTLSKNIIFKGFLEKKIFTDKQIKKVKFCLWDEFNNDETSIHIQVTSYILLKKFFLLKGVKIFYFTQDLSSYLILKQLKNKNLKIFGSIAAINYFFYIIFLNVRFLINVFKKFNIKIKKIFNKNESFKNKNYSIDIDKASKFNFAFFPHTNSLKYGLSFDKTFIYENDINSLLYKEKVLTVWTRKPDNLSIRYLRKNKIPYLIMSDYLKSNDWINENLHLIKIFLFNLTKLENWKLENLCILKLLFFFNRKLIRSKDFMDQLVNLKTFFVDFDHLFPKAIVLAADLSGKKSIAYQERTMAHIWMPNLIYNYYLINGENFKNLFEKRKYVIDEYLTVGMHRSRLAKLKNRPRSEYERLKIIKNKFKLVLCLPLVRVTDYNVDLWGEDGTSVRSEINFYNDLIKLAKKFKDHYFLIKPKEIVKENYFNDYPKEILENLKNLPNIELHNNTKINSYELAYFTDLAIGKATTLMEEILSLKKPIIYHDPENNLSTYKYEINKLNIIAKSYDQLELKFHDILKSNYFLNKDITKFIDNFLVSNKNINNSDLILESIKQISNKEKN